MSAITPTTFGWFDFVTIGFLAVGFRLGWTKGLSAELLPTAQWLAALITASVTYHKLGAMIAGLIHVSNSSGYVLAYTAAILAVVIIFVLVRKALGEKISGTNLFGRMEFYLGSLAGLIKLTCILFIILAFLNSWYVSEEQMSANAKMQKDNFGSISFPTMGSIQQDVFTRSLSGRFTKDKLAMVLIQPKSAAEEPAPKKDSMGKKREDAVDEVLGGPKK